MANETISTGFPGVVKHIFEQASVMAYEGTLLDKLCKPVGKGQKGNSVVFPYLDPSTLAAAATIGTEATDFSGWTQVQSASLIVLASEFIEGVLLTDKSVQSMTFDIAGETARQLTLGLNAKKENHIFNVAVSQFATGTLTQASATLGISLTELAKGMATLDSRKLTVPGPYDYVTSGLGWYYTAVGTYSATYAAALPGVGDEILKNWYKGQLFGKINVYTDNYVTGSATGVTAMFAHRAAIGYWEPQPLRIEDQRDASLRATEYVATVRGGAKIIAPSYGIRIVARTV